MSLSYTTGNPANLTAGSTASMTDISGPFADVKTFLTDGSGAVGDTILTSPGNGVWRPIFNVSCSVPAGSASGTYYIASNVITPSSASNTGSPEQFCPSSADVTVSSKTTRLRVVVAYAVNAVGPGVTLTWGLYPVTGIGGAATTMSWNLGTVLAGSTAAVASPAANAGNRVASSSFDYSTASATTYLAGLALSGITAASSYVNFSYRLEQRHT